MFQDCDSHASSGTCNDLWPAGLSRLMSCTEFRVVREVCMAIVTPAEPVWCFPVLWPLTLQWSIFNPERHLFSIFLSCPSSVSFISVRSIMQGLCSCAKFWSSSSTVVVITFEVITLITSHLSEKVPSAFCLFPVLVCEDLACSSLLHYVRRGSVSYPFCFVV